MNQEIAANFVQFYFDKFNSERQDLNSFYGPDSYRTFETFQDHGSSAIMERLIAMPIKKINRRVSTFDVQPSGSDGSIICTITGELQIDDEPNLQRFTHVMLLSPVPGNSVLIRNEIFRLNYC